MVFIQLQAQSEKELMLKDLIHRIHGFDSQQLYDSSIFYYDQAILIAAELEDELNIAYLNKIKGTDYISLSKLDSALHYLNKAISAARDLENDTLYIASTLNLAYTLHRMGLADSAELLVTQCLDLAESIGYLQGQAKALNMLAIHYKNTGRFAKGLDAAQKSLYILEKLGDKKRYISALATLASIYEKINNLDSAYSYYKLCYDLSQKHNDPRNEFIAFFNLAAIDLDKAKHYLESGNRDTAVQLLQRAENTFSESVEKCNARGDKRNLAESYLGLTQIYILIGNFSKAKEYAERAINVASEINDEIIAIRALSYLGTSYLSTGEYETAEKFYLKGFIRAKNARDNESVLDITFSLSELYTIMDDVTKANEYLRLHIQYKDSIYTVETARLIQEYLTDYEIQQLNDLRQIETLKKEKLRSERNIIIIVGVFLIMLLLGIIQFFWMRARKNKVIAAQKIRQLEDEKKLLATQSVLVGQEEERKRIARELHDGIGVMLSTAKIQFSAIGEDETDKKVSDTFRKAQKMLDNAGKEVRRISHDMMPGVLSKFGLRDAIEDLFEEIRDTGKLDIRLTLKCSSERLPENLEIMLYRVVQEMLNNTIKHAKASRIDCTVTRKPQAIEIDYADDGIGFDEDALPQDKSLGLFGIRSRVDFLSGTVDIKSAKDKGTRFHILVPLILDVKRG
jgi:signal transduction histidine kinase